MLLLTRYFSKNIGNNFLKCTFQSNLKSNYCRKLFIYNSCNTMKNNSISIGKKLFRQSGTIAINFASKADKKAEKLVGSWLLTCGGMVFVAVVLGGVTRLTESGLSMVTWKLLGEQMPTTEIQWVEEFERYKQFPEYKITNKNMTLEEFKRIWWMEYLHRMWGRLIGATFIIPAAYFWVTGRLKPGMKLRVGILGSLIGLQGLMGWYMVKSGLEDRFNGPSDVPRVSQYRLAAHLGLAITIYMGFLYNALDHLIPAKKLDLSKFSATSLSEQIKKLKLFKTVVYSTKGLVFLTALSGAFVAGMDAGLIYNTFPKMGGKWIPDDIFVITPFLKNFTENPTTVQFDHRVLAMSSLSLIVSMGYMARSRKFPGNGKIAVNAVLAAGCLQVFLGLVTLLTYVPVSVAAMHQSGSLILLSVVTWLCHELKYIKKLPK